MLILCSGPDTFNARQKARELVEAFRKKHDPSGFSIDVMKQADLAELLQKLSAPSFFSAKRLVRCDGLFDKLKIADVRSLAKRLVADNDQTIVMSVENEEPPAKTLNEFDGVKVFKYTYPLLVGKAFVDWCRKRGAEIGVASIDCDNIARVTEGNAWQAEQELMKKSANPAAPLAEDDDAFGTVFDIVDSYFRNDPSWRHAAFIADDDQLLATTLSQSRSFMRVQNGETKGIHPYVVRKLSMLRTSDAKEKFLHALRATIASRTSFAGASETDLLL